MRQLAKVESDVFNGASFPQQWLRQTDNSTTDLFTMMQDTTYGSPIANDNIYVNQGLNPGDEAVCAFKLSEMSAPPIRPGPAINVTMVYTCGYRLSGDAVTILQLQLREGYVDEANQGTLIAQVVEDGFTLTTSIVTKQITFSGLGITNWANLYLRCVTSVPSLHPFVPNDGMRVGTVFFIAEQAGLFRSNKIDQFPGRASYRSELRILGSTNGSPIIQLINDSTHFKLRVYRLDVWGQINTGGHTGLDRQSAYGIRRTDNPFNPGTGATVTFGNIIRLDPDDVSLLAGTVRGMDFNDEQYHNIVGQTGYEYEDIDDSDGDGILSIFSQLIVAPSTYPSNRPFQIRPPGGFPWTIMPLSALEVAWLDNGAARVCHAAFEWDKVTI